MGKVKKESRNSAARADPTGQSSRRSQQAPKPRPPLQVTPQTEQIRTSRVVPAVEKLSSEKPKEREAGLAAICGLLGESETCRLITLKERVVQKLLEERIHDDSEGVVVLAWKALRIVAQEEGYDQCMYMFRKNIVSRINDAIAKLAPAIENAASNPSTNPLLRDQIWLFVDNVVRLTKVLSEASIPILDDITKNIPSLPAFLIGILKPEAKAPAEVICSTSECLSSLTEDNDDLTSKIASQKDYVSLLMSLRTNDIPLVRICSCATLHNISLGPEGSDFPDLSDTLLLSTLTSYLKHIAASDLSSYDPSTSSATDKASIRATEIALDTIGSIATSLGYDLEDGAGKEGRELEHEDIIGSGDESDEEMGEAGEELDDALRDDMAMVTVSDDEDDEDSGASSSSTARHLLDQTLPLLSRLSLAFTPALKPLRVRALLAMNNVSWTGSSLATEFPSFTKRWVPRAQEIWKSVVTPVFSESPMDVGVAEAVTGVAWAVAKSLNGRVTLGDKQHHGFIALYRAAEATNLLKVNCIGVLGCLAMVQEPIDINKDIGIFLVGLISEAPNVPAEPVVAALNAIFDIYGDAEFAYDGPVFLQNGFNKHLELALPKIRTLVRRIDKNKQPELKREADEAAINLDRFIKYKKKELTQKGKNRK